MVTFLSNSITSPKEHHWYWLMLKRGGSFNTTKSFCLYMYKAAGPNLFNLSLNHFFQPVTYRQCCHSGREAQVLGAGQWSSPGSGLERHSRSDSWRGPTSRCRETLSLTPPLQRKATHRPGHLLNLKGTQLPTWQTARTYKLCGAVDS